MSIQIRGKQHSTESAGVEQEIKLNWWRLMSMTADTGQAGFSDVYWREIRKDFEKVINDPS